MRNWMPGRRTLALLALPAIGAFLPSCTAPEFTSSFAVGYWGSSTHLQRTRDGVKHGPAWETGRLAREVLRDSALERRLDESADPECCSTAAGGLYRDGRREGVWTVWVECVGGEGCAPWILEILGQVVFESGVRTRCSVEGPWAWPILTRTCVEMLHDDAWEDVRWRTPGGSEARYERMGPTMWNSLPPDEWKWRVPDGAVEEKSLDRPSGEDLEIIR